ncbi:hypothetical protein BDC45DRAFT_521439 [Circinella umbellata]|nr:hypothetical protein BDC45DRAFT_521439 [Circinella umbellata]
MNVDSPRPIKKTKGSFKKSQKREGLATVDENRFPQQRQQQKRKPIKRCLSSSSSSSWSFNGDDFTISQSAVREEACKYSQEDLVNIRQNLSANLTLAKRRMMVKLSQSNIPQDMQMYEYLTKTSERNKKRRNQKKKNDNAAPIMTGGKLKQHRPQLLKKTPPQILPVNHSVNSSHEVIKKEENEIRPVETLLALPITTMLTDPLQGATTMITEDESMIPTPSAAQQLRPLLSPIINGEELVGGEIKTAEPVVPLDILFGGYHDEIMTTTDEEPNSLCDPLSSPLIPACVRDPAGENEETAWDMSNHAAGLLNGLLYEEDSAHTIDNVVASREPIDFWVQNTMVISDQDMSDLLEFDYNI